MISADASTSHRVIASGGDMATLAKFRLLATQCGVAPSPTRSPTTSPMVHVRRQKTTLWMLFSRNAGPRSRDKPAQPKKFGSELTGNSSRATLKDLFGSSPSFEQSDSDDARKSDVISGGGGGLDSVMVGPGSQRPGFMGLRYRALLRKAWRPMLETIPE